MCEKSEIDAIVGAERFHNVDGNIHDAFSFLFDDLAGSSDYFLFYKDNCEMWGKKELYQYAKCFGIQGVKHLEHCVLQFLTAAIGAHPMESPSSSNRPKKPLVSEDFIAIDKLLHNVRKIGSALCHNVTFLDSKISENER